MEWWFWYMMISLLITMIVSIAYLNYEVCDDFLPHFKIFVITLLLWPAVVIIVLAAIIERDNYE